LKIRKVSPCAESNDGLNIEFYFEHKYDLKLLVRFLEENDNYDTVQYFENSNILWFRTCEKNVLVEKEGLITVYNVENIEKGVDIVKNIIKIIKKGE